MPRVSAAFYATAVVFALLGMAWGMQIAAGEDMVVAPAHAHLSLVGWVTMAIYGTFYALTRGTLITPLAWINYVLSLLGTLIMISALAFFLHHGRDPIYVPFTMIGEVLTVLGMFVFAISVFRELIRPRPS